MAVASGGPLPPLAADEPVLPEVELVVAVVPESALAAVEVPVGEVAEDPVTTPKTVPDRSAMVGEDELDRVTVAEGGVPVTTGAGETAVHDDPFHQSSPVPPVGSVNLIVTELNELEPATFTSK